MKIPSILIAASLVLTTASLADIGNYTVTITNITKGVPVLEDGSPDASTGIQFTPVLAAAHTNGIAFFEVGQAASEPLAAIAEGGAIGDLRTVLESVPDIVRDSNASTGLLFPGQSTEIDLTADSKTDYLSLSAMLLPTNDTFVALNTVAFPKKGSVTYYAKAYDAGSEANDELCSNIPGPACGGTPFSPDDAGEGFVYPSPGIHGEADLSVAAYGWSGPVAKVTVTRTEK